MLQARVVDAAVVFRAYRQETIEIVAICAACCLCSESGNVSGFRELAFIRLTVSQSVRTAM